MLTEQLPKQVNPRKLAAQGISINAKLPLDSLPRLLGILENDRGEIEVDLRFDRDEQGLYCISGSIKTIVDVVCQRCLETMSVALDCNVALAVVWDDVDARQLPKEYEPLVVGEDSLDLYEMVEDEILLSLPFVNYHEPAECKGKQRFSTNPKSEGEVKAAKENPFGVLEKLKSNKSN